MGRSTPSFWTGRQVFVTAAASPLGRELVGDLLARRAGVVVLLGRTDTLCDLGRTVAIVRGRADDHSRLTTAFVLHDIRIVFHLADTGLAAVRTAARLAGVTVVVPPVASTDPVGDLLWRAETLALPAARLAA